jgi:hypothetical protein
VVTHFLCAIELFMPGFLEALPNWASFLPALCRRCSWQSHYSSLIFWKTGDIGDIPGLGTGCRDPTRISPVHLFPP